jgi:SAM-dependent methyltransferase
MRPRDDLATKRAAQGRKGRVDERLLLSFDSLEETHWWFVVRRRIVLDAAAPTAPRPWHHILEVGCGTGGTMRALRTRFPDAAVKGIEPVEAAARLAAGKGCDVESGTFEHLPIESSSVDLILALDVLEHLADDGLGLAEAFRVLRPGGRLIATVPALPSQWSVHDELNAHFRRYTREGLVAAARGAGFGVRRVTYFNSLLLPLAGLERAAVRLLSLPRSPAVALPPRPLNAVLRTVFGLERPILARTDLPLGLSLLLVATRPAQP